MSFISYGESYFVLKVFIFCSEFLILKENGLTRELRLISRFMVAQTGKEIIKIHILSNISNGKGNPAMKFAHLILQLEKYFSSKIIQRMNQED